jgi:hypothetical protein
LREAPRLLVDRIVGRRREQVVCHSFLHRRLTLNVGIRIHDVVRVQKADHHEKGLPFPVQRRGIGAQPANRFAGVIAVDLIALIRRAELVAIKVEDIEAVGLQGRVIIDRRVDLEQILVLLRQLILLGFLR